MSFFSTISSPFTKCCGAPAVPNAARSKAADGKAADGRDTVDDAANASANANANADATDKKNTGLEKPRKGHTTTTTDNTVPPPVPTDTNPAVTDQAATPTNPATVPGSLPPKMPADHAVAGEPVVVDYEELTDSEDDLPSVPSNVAGLPVAPAVKAKLDPNPFI